MELEKYDETLLGILKENGQIFPFLDTIFGFLYRCTDFYHIQKDPSDKLGFQKGAALNIVHHVYNKWEAMARQDEQDFSDMRNEKKVSNKNSESNEHPGNKSSASSDKKELSKSTEVKSENKEDSIATSQECSLNKSGSQQSGDSYNGAVREGYRWSQSITDLDVHVTVGPHVTKSQDVKVDATNTRLTVTTSDSEGKWSVLIDDDLCFKTKKEESMWTLTPGQEIQVHLEKAQERWWDALLVSEPKIDIQKIDASRPMTDLPQEEQMKIQELMWNQERKRQGLKTSQEIEQEKLLRQCWDAEGSPFKGQPFDPSIVKFQNAL